MTTTITPLRALLGAFAIATILVPGVASAAEKPNKKCAMMTDEDVEEGKVVDFKGNKIYMCCGGCVRAWNSASDAGKAYWVKAAIEEGALKNLKGKEKELGLEDVEFIEQRFSAVSFKTIVTPESPTVEYDGKKYHVFSAKEQEKWAKDPEGSYKKAVKAKVIK